MTEGTQGGDGGGGGDFLQTISTELRSDGTLQSFAGADGGSRLAKAYGDLVRSNSSRRMADMPVPGDDLGRKAVLQKLGVGAPDTADGYKLPDSAPGRQFREWAHRHGLSASQAEGMYGDMTGFEEKSAGDRKSRADQRALDDVEKLKADWGEQYTANAEISKRGYEHFLPEPERKIFEAMGLHNNAAVVKVFHNLGRALAEGTMHTGAGSGGGPTDAAGFKSERLKIEGKMTEMKNSGHFDGTSEVYRDLVKQRTELGHQETLADIATGKEGA